MGRSTWSWSNNHWYISGYDGYDMNLKLQGQLERRLDIEFSGWRDREAATHSIDGRGIVICWLSEIRNSKTISTYQQSVLVQHVYRLSHSAYGTLTNHAVALTVTNSSICLHLDVLSMCVVAGLPPNGKVSGDKPRATARHSMIRVFVLIIPQKMALKLGHSPQYTHDNPW